MSKHAACSTALPTALCFHCEIATAAKTTLTCTTCVCIILRRCHRRSQRRRGAMRQSRRVTRSLPA